MSKAKIMIVEDEWITAEDIKMRLQALGYTVSSPASTGKEAIQKAKEDKPDLVLMDIVLKGEMDGIEAASQIHTCLDIPIIYLTAYADEKILDRAKITKPSGYIVKPFIDEDLKIAIEIALYKHKSEKERKD
ncbi:MAG: two-component system response regulator [Planctomycetes bacterium GWF2_40_8]|nr:MAG: two-component system response regulator [Planctomycetes bacterium GWF2_40_8]OHB86762.1 MAG: two-component system response regulator [Planctomycetes bacterium RIFCSPHIGHO2_02_FULL_40_12]OHC04237.1 MAG: two-component system response regulator [Planctomycetes bacterium RIFCSPLOWO2_12_FULL_40_19]